MKMNGRREIQKQFFFFFCLDHARRLLHIFLISITIQSSYFQKQLKEQKIGKLCFSSWTTAFSLLDSLSFFSYFKQLC